MKTKLRLLLLPFAFISLCGCTRSLITPINNPEANSDPDTEQSGDGSIVNGPLTEREFIDALNPKGKNMTYTVYWNYSSPFESIGFRAEYKDDYSFHVTHNYPRPEAYFRINPDGSMDHIRNVGDWCVVDCNSVDYFYDKYDWFTSLLDDVSFTFSEFAFNETLSSYSGVVYSESEGRGINFEAKFNGKQLSNLYISSYDDATTINTMIIVENYDPINFNFDSLSIRDTFQVINRRFVTGDLDITGNHGNDVDMRFDSETSFYLEVNCNDKRVNEYLPQGIYNGSYSFNRFGGTLELTILEFPNLPLVGYLYQEDYLYDHNYSVKFNLTVLVRQNELFTVSSYIMAY